MNTQKQPKPDEHSLNFMLAEFETLRCLRSDMSSVGESRVNIFLAVVSGGFVGLALLYESSGLEAILPFVTALVLASLIILGLITFGRALERDINIKMYARGLNRIRRYFVQLDPDLREYLLLPTVDDRPRFKSMGWRPSSGQFQSLESTVAIINSIVATVAVLALTAGILGLGNVQVATIGILAFLVVCVAHYRYMSIRYEKAERQTETRFPSHNE